MNAVADNRLVSQVQDIKDALATIRALSPKSVYNLRTSRNDVALIAQNEQGNVPQIIASGADGYLCMDYARLSVWLVGAMQTMDDRLAALETTVAGLTTP